MAPYIDVPLTAEEEEEEEIDEIANQPSFEDELDGICDEPDGQGRYQEIYQCGHWLLCPICSSF